MSSNAFARSRPRVRHQRVPRTHGYVHPRFLQLVKELARIDEAKKKLEDPEPDLIDFGSGESGCSSGGGDCNTTTGCSVTISTGRTGDCSSSTTTITSGHQHNHPSLINNSECCSSAQNLTSCSSGTSCCSAVNGAQASNGYRSLACDQSTSATTTTTNDNYYRQHSNNNNNNHHQLNNYQQNHTNHHHHNHHHRDNTNHQSNSNLHHQAHPHPSQHQDDRCIASKSSSSSSSTSGATTTNICITTSTTNLGYLKQGLVEQNNSDFSNVNSDLRQDENRSKRKRSSNDSSSSSKKLSASSSSSCGKRHKSSPEPIRPLSPSFTKCPICLLDCMDRDPSFTNTCFHLFCFVCIENWTKNKATCPLCRTKFTKIIYNIRSASCYDEKVASPIRRDDEDERVIIYEQLQGINTNQMVPNRGSNAEETRASFDRMRANEVLMPPFNIYNHMDHRQESLRSFSSTTTATNFNSTVPHHTLFNYNPTPSNYLLIPSVSLNPRVQQQLANTHDPLSSAYAVDTGLANSGSDPNRVPRAPRGGRYIYPRNYDLQPIDNPVRVSRTSGSASSSATGGGINSTGLPLDRQTHHNQHQHPNHHHHGQHGLHGQHRSTTLDLAPRQNQRMDHSHIHMAHSNMPRYYNPSVYSRRPYTNPPIDPHILDNLYRQMPDI